LVSTKLLKEIGVLMSITKFWGVEDRDTAPNIPVWFEGGWDDIYSLSSVASCCEQF
jgi:hypothetical protein